MIFMLPWVLNNCGHIFSIKNTQYSKLVYQNQQSFKANVIVANQKKKVPSSYQSSRSSFFSFLEKKWERRETIS